MAIPFLSNIDLNKNQLLNHTLHNATSNPSTPNEGQIYYNTSSDKVLVYNGSAWISIAGDIESVSAGTYLNGGGTTGALTINHDNTTRSDTTSADGPAYGGTFQAVTGVTTNPTGHVTAIDVSTVTIPASDNTDTLQSIAAASDDDDKFITFVETATGAQTGMSGANFKFNPGTDTLKVTNLVVSGTQTVQNETIQIVENNTIQFEGTDPTTDFEVKLTAADATTADKTITLPDLSGHVALLAAAATETITATPAELNLLDGITTLSGSNTGDEPDASTTVKGIVELATSDETKTGTDTAKAVTPDSLAARTVVATIDVSNSTLAGQTAPFKATIAHSLGTKDLIVQLQDVTTFEVIHADISTVDFAGSESTSEITIGFDNALPTNDVRVIITSGAGATSITPTYA